MKVEFEIKINFPIDPSQIYEAWLNSKLHSEMTGGKATCSNIIGDQFSAWDNYISGKNIELIPNKLIRQSWRTTDFKDSDQDSIITISLVKIPEGSTLFLKHENIPEDQPDYYQGWNEHYFIPMKAFLKNK